MRPAFGSTPSACSAPYVYDFPFDSVRSLLLYVQCAPPLTLGFLLYYTLYSACMMHDLSYSYHRISYILLTYSQHLITDCLYLLY